MDEIVYVSFDIECAQSYKDYSPICNFGYVIYDNNFNLLKKEDIIINPNSKFKLKGRKGREDIEMAYPEEVYKKSPHFIAAYSKIKKILENKNAIIIGQSIRNDIDYLNWEVNKRKINKSLESINFKGYDLVDFVKAYEQSGNPMSLVAIKDRMNLSDFRPHKADDDANTVILILKKILDDLEISFDQLVDLTNSLQYESRNGELIKPYLNKKEKNKLKIDNIKKTENIESQYSNKVISYSKGFEKTEIYFEMLQWIVNINSSHSTKVSESNLFVFMPKDGEVDVRKEKALSLGLEIIEIEDLFDIS